MAEALLRQLGSEDFAAFSAGTDPKPIHPLTQRVLSELNLDISGQHSKDLAQFLTQSFDYIITVCDRARDNCPTFPGDNELIHWSFDDPAAATGTPEEVLRQFRRVRDEIRERIRLWVTVQRSRAARRAVGK